MSLSLTTTPGVVAGLNSVLVGTLASDVGALLGAGRGEAVSAGVGLSLASAVLHVRFKHGGWHVHFYDDRSLKWVIENVPAAPQDVLREARTGEREREDSFARLHALIPARAAA